MLNPHGMYIEAPVSGRVLALWQGLKSALSECAEMHHSQKSTLITEQKRAEHSFCYFLSEGNWPVSNSLDASKFQPTRT